MRICEDLAWGSFHSLSPVLLVGNFCLAGAGYEDQPLCRIEKGLIRFRRAVDSSPETLALLIGVTVLEVGNGEGQ